MPTKVGPKYQVVVEKRWRRQLDVQPGSTAVQHVDGDRLVIRFVKPADNRSLYGALRQYSGQLEKDLGTAIDEAVAEGVTDEYGAGRFEA